MFSLLRNLYLHCKAKQEKSVSFVLLGLDNAGKTTTLQCLKGDVPDDSVTPTNGFKSEHSKLGPYELTLIDLGGGPRIRGIWKHYYAEVYGAVWVVDSTDRERFVTVKEVMAATMQNELFKGKPVLILANKQDLAGAVSVDDIKRELGLDDVVPGEYRVEPCHALPPNSGEVDPRIKKGFQWLLNVSTKDYRKTRAAIEEQLAEQKRQRQKENEEKRKRIEANRAARLKEEAEAAERKREQSKEGGDGNGVAVEEEKHTTDIDNAGEGAQEDVSEQKNGKGDGTVLSPIAQVPPPVRMMRPSPLPELNVESRMHPQAGGAEVIASPSPGTAVTATHVLAQMETGSASDYDSVSEEVPGESGGKSKDFGEVSHAEEEEEDSEEEEVEGLRARTRTPALPADLVMSSPGAEQHGKSERAPVPPNAIRGSQSPGP